MYNVYIPHICHLFYKGKIANFTRQLRQLHSKLPIFRVLSVKIYTGQFFTQAPSVVPLTNMRYECIPSLYICIYVKCLTHPHACTYDV